MKSRTILKYQYDELGNFLCDQYVLKHKLQDKKHEAEKKITDIMAEDLPDLVKEAYKKYPKYFALKARDISDVMYFINVNTVQYNPEDRNGQRNIKSIKTNYSEGAINYANDLYTTIKELNLHEQYSHSYWGYDSRYSSNLFSFKFKGLEITEADDNDRYRYDYRKDVNVIGTYIQTHPKVGEILKEYIIELCKYNKFRKDISCAFSTITTTNMLKNEIPEAYDYFYKKWGKEYEQQDADEKSRKKAEKKAQCDKIEALRASIA